MPRKKHQLGMRISDEAVQNMESLQAYHGLSQAALFEMLVRQEARRANVGPAALDVPEAPPKRSHKKKVAA